METRRANDGAPAASAHNQATRPCGPKPQGRLNTARAAKAGHRRTRPAGGRAAHGRRQAKPICALHDGAPPTARRLRPRRRPPSTTRENRQTTRRSRRAPPCATSLKADPGTGLATPRDVSRAAWGGGRRIEPTRSARPVTDQGQLCISPCSRTGPTRPPSTQQRDPGPTHPGRRRGLGENGSRSEPSSQASVGRLHTREQTRQPSHPVGPPV